MNKICIVIILMFLLVMCKKEQVDTVKPEADGVNICLAIYMKGTVHIVDEKFMEQEPVSVGDSIPEDKIIKTGLDSFVELKIGEGSTVRVMENTIVRIRKLYKDEETENTNLSLDIGEIFAKPRTLEEGSSFEVETQSITAGVRGTEFYVRVDKDKTSSVAVKEGNVSITKNFSTRQTQKVTIIDEKLGIKIDDIIEKDVLLHTNEKIEVAFDDFKKVEQKLDKIIENISEDIETYKKQQEDIENSVKEIEMLLAKMDRKQTVEPNEWKREYEERDEAEVPEVEDDKQDEEENIKTPEGDDLDITESDKDEPGEKEETVVDKDEVKDTNDVGTKLTETVEERVKVLVTKVDKLSGNPGLNLSEKGTYITGSKGHIFITDKKSKSVYGINSTTGNIAWRFTDQKIKMLQSSVISFNNKFVVATTDNIFILNAQGTKVAEKDIENGVNLWVKPVVHRNKVYVPTARTLFIYDGSSIDRLPAEQFPEAESQLFISGYGKLLFTVDSFTHKIKAYNLETNAIDFVSDKFGEMTLNEPVVAANYVIVAGSKSSIYRLDYKAGNEQPVTLNVGKGVISNIVAHKSAIYFVANDGYFYKVSVNTFSNAVRKYQVDASPVSDKYLVKKLLKVNAMLYFVSDNNKLFRYDLNTDKGDFVDVTSSNGVLLGTPVAINDSLYVVDTVSAVFRIYDTYEYEDALK